MQIRALALIFSLLLGLLGTVLLSGCSSSSLQSARSPAPPSKNDSTRTERIWTRIEQTPDSLATLPRPLFYRSSAPVEGTPLKLKGIGSRAEVEAVGGITDQNARWGLRIHSVVSDSTLIRPFPYVDLHGRRMVMRREQAWRTFWEEDDSLHEERFVPLSTRDIQRFAAADTMRLDLNWGEYRLPAAFRSDLQALYRSMPDSVTADTAVVENRLTVFHSVENMPKLKDTSLTEAVTYPEAAKVRGIKGVVVVEFLVLPNGSTTHLQIDQPSHPILNEAALKAIREVEFDKPGRHRGQPVPVFMSLPVTFNLAP